MCEPASFIVTRHDVLYSRVSDHHDIILAEHDIRDDSLNPAFVRVEVTPPRMDFLLPFDEWEFRTDQDLLPDWYSRGEAEAACRRQLPAWAEHHLKVVGQGVFGDGLTKDLIAYDGNLGLRWTRIRRLPDGLTVEGDLDLGYTKIEKLPNDLTVGRNLNIYYTKIDEFPENLKVGGDLNAWGVSIKRYLGPSLVRGRVHTHDSILWEHLQNSIESYMAELGSKNV